MSKTRKGMMNIERRKERRGSILGKKHADIVELLREIDECIKLEEK